MHDLCLINLIVGRGDGEAFLDFLGDQGVKTAHSLPCRGTAGKKLLDLLGLEESEKTLLWAMTSRARAGRLLARLVREMGLDMPGAGIAFTTPVGSVAGATSLRSLTEGQDIIMGEVTDMPAAFLYELIIAIVNRGHADTVMDAARAAGVDVDGIADTTQVVESPDDTPDDRPLLSFTLSDRAAADELPERLTTEQYVTVTTLLDKLRQCEEFDGMERYLAKLSAAKREIAAIQAEIDSINAEVREKLYPFDGITLKDRKTVNGIVARYNALSEYDRTQIERWEDVVKTKTKLDNILRGIVIGVALSVIAAVVAVFLVRRIRRRRHRKEREMEELAARYRDEL